jgi:hypothetical protein
LEFFAQHPDLRAALGANARAFATQGHSLERAAGAYADFLSAVHEGRAESKSYLCEGERERPGHQDAGTGSRGGPETGAGGDTKHVGKGRLSPSRHLEPPTSLPDSVARDCAALGLGADDPTLYAVARAIVELGIGGGEIDR